MGSNGRSREYVSPMSEPTKSVAIHGRRIAYSSDGTGPVLLLIHGMAGTCESWREVIEPLARHHTVIAPDFPGHGGSAPGGGDYSIGGLAAGLRDLLLTLGHDRATLVGHSLGGGVAMQFAYSTRRWSNAWPWSRAAASGPR